MKNLKKKIGISLAALAFFATVGFASKNAWAVKPNPLYIFGASEEENAVKKDPKVMKVIDTVKQIKGMLPSYETPDGKKINVYWDGGVKEKGVKKEYLDLKISKESENRAVAIRDYNYNNLDSNDEISYDTTHVFKTLLLPDYTTRKTVKFGELSSKTQEELVKEYNRIIEEAPEKLLKAYKEYQQKNNQQQIKEKEELEKNIINILK